jgi:hypothetical protein
VSDLGEAPAPDPDEPVEVAQLDSPRHEKVARAYLLHIVQRQTIDYTAQALGVSRATAWRMAKQGEAQAAFLRSTDEQVRNALADGAGWLIGALAAERETLGGRWLDYAPEIRKTFELEAKIRGALAAQQVAIQGRVGTGPDPDTVAALQALLEKEGGP